MHLQRSCSESLFSEKGSYGKSSLIALDKTVLLKKKKKIANVRKHKVNIELNYLNTMQIFFFFPGANPAIFRQVFPQRQKKIRDPGAEPSLTTARCPGLVKAKQVLHTSCILFRVCKAQHRGGSRKELNFETGQNLWQYFWVFTSLQIFTCTCSPRCTHSHHRQSKVLLSISLWLLTRNVFDFIRHCTKSIVVDSATWKMQQSSSPVSYTSIIVVNPVLATPVDEAASSGRHGAILAQLVSHCYRSSMPVRTFSNEFNCTQFVEEAD